MIHKTITSTKDILSREASHLCNLFNYKASLDTTVYLKKANDDRICSAKSLLGVLSLVIRKDDEIVFLINGSNEQEVAIMIDNFFSDEE